MKAILKRILHFILGINRFLYYFSLYKIRTLKKDKKEGDLYLFIDTLKNSENYKDKTGLILDIGANIGITSGVLGKETDLKIHAYEPLKLNYEVLEKVIQKQGLGTRVSIFKKALGNYRGECEMILPVVDSVKMHGLSHVVDPNIKEFNEGHNVDHIPIDLLDNIYKEQKVTGIKMDVENYEYQVLLGAEKLLKEQKPIVYIELWDNENRLNCFDFLRKLNYKSYHNVKGTLKPFENNETQTQNFIFMV